MSFQERIAWVFLALLMALLLITAVLQSLSAHSTVY